MDFNIPRIPLGDGIEKTIDFLDTNFSFITKSMSKGIETVIDLMVAGMTFIHPVLFIIIITVLSWYLTKKRELQLFHLQAYPLF